MDWKSISSEPLTLESIRNLHAPASHYRISPNSYRPGTAFAGTSMAGRIYVLAGACVKVMGGQRIELRQGMYADFPAGDYAFEVIGPREVNLVNVWLADV
jgi:hypothetical protein